MNDFSDFSDLIEESKKYKPCMVISVDKESSSVELMLDTARNYVGEWIPGEGGDICIFIVIKIQIKLLASFYLC